MGGNIYWAYLKRCQMWKSGETTGWMGKSDSHELIHGVKGDDTNLVKLLRERGKKRFCLANTNVASTVMDAAEAAVCSVILPSGWSAVQAQEWLLDVKQLPTPNPSKNRM